MVTKKQAIEILKETVVEEYVELATALAMIEALDRAGAFAAELTPAEVLGLHMLGGKRLDHDTADLIDVLVQAGAVRTSRDALDVITAFRKAGKL